jgi:hypothetical protein
MKFLLAALLAFAPALCAAASPEAGYFDARDQFIARIKSLDAAGKGEDALKQQETAEAELTKTLRTIVGPLAVKRYPADGKANIGSLFAGDEGFGTLDGLLYTASDGKGFLIVTTETIFNRWLRDHKNWWGSASSNVPQQIEAALRSDAFYSQALQTDAAISSYAELPVSRPASAKFVHAVLVARSQILDPRAPDELLVALVRDGRVFVSSAQAGVVVKSIAACDAIWAEYRRKATALRAAYAKPELKEQNITERSDEIDEAGSAAFRRCFAQRASQQAFFTPLTEQAQTMIDALTAN